MNCKFCNAELEEGVTLCPSCGKENAEEIVEETAEVTEAEETAEEVAEEVAEETTEETAEEVAEETTEETGEEVTEETAEETPEAPKKKRKLWVSIVAIVCLVALAATLVGSVIYGMKASQNTDSYTVSDTKAQKESATVVAKVGEEELTNSQLQVYYWQAVSDFYSYYGYYMDMETIGLDIEKPLDQQYYDEANGVTWQKYFLETALNTWHRYAVLATKGKAEGFALDAEALAYLEDVPNQLEELAVMYGYADAATMLRQDMSPACDLEGYLDFIELNLYVSHYFDHIYATLEPSDAELEDYYAANTETLNNAGIVKDGSMYVDVRHILLCPEAANEEAETFTDAEWEACRQQAQGILDQWLAGDKTEESFAALAMEHSQDPGSQAEGGLYTDVTVGQMVEPFENWCFDATRKTGDYGLVQTEYGYHIMYFVSSEEAWKCDLRSQLVNERSTAMVDESIAKYPLDADFKKIVLGQASTTEEDTTDTAAQ